MEWTKSFFRVIMLPKRRGLEIFFVFRFIPGRLPGDNAAARIYFPNGANAHLFAGGMEQTPGSRRTRKIYIEGDGRAFDIDGQPTSDPTPRGTMLREIAFGDTHPNVVYLGRPCQFVTNSACRQNIGPRRASPPKSLMRKPKPSNSLHKTVR